MALIQARKGRKKKIERKEIYKLIDLERARQEKFNPMLKIKKEHDDEIKTMTTIINNGEILAVLVENIGEIGKALQGEGNLTDELINAAAVCIRWLEYKDPAE